jgi:hypothetical protein
VDLGRRIELADLLQKADFVAAGADDLRAAVADGAVHDPCPDRVHAVDFGKVDGQRIGHCIDFALRRGCARDRQRSGDPVHRAVRVIRLLLLEIGHWRGLMREMPEMGK